jgi:lipopolysaccharide export system permease protein
MVIYVSDSDRGDYARGIIIADERNPAEARIIVAGDYRMLNDPVNGKLGIRLIDGSIHSKPHNPAQYHQVSFSTYDLPVPIGQTLYAPEERQSRESVLAELDRSNWTDPGALRRLMEYYKDLAFPTASFIFAMLGVPVGIVSKRSGRIGGFAVGVFVVIVYYVLNVLFEFFVTTRVIHPFAGAWLPNGLFFVATLVLFYRVNRR